MNELDEGRDVCLITLGCPTVYATSIYVHRLIRQAGYATEIVPGVPSFCAVAAELQQPLCEKMRPSSSSPAIISTAGTCWPWTAARSS